MQQDDRGDAVRVVGADTASAAPSLTQSTSAGAAEGSVGGGTTASGAAAPDRPDLHLHLDPTRTQVAVFLGVFLLGLAAALVMTSTRSAGAHRRH